MKQSSKRDLICINKIIKYIALISKAYRNAKIKTLEDFEADEVCQLAIAQAITNIYEVKKNIQTETLKKTPVFDNILLKAARNIASHDYDSLDFKIVYKRTEQLLSDKVKQELEVTINDIKQDSESDK